MGLYSIRTDRAATSYGIPQFIINKFDDDLNPEASYLVSAQGCTCPAGHRPSCRHRKMLSRMLSHIDDGWFYDYEHQNWHRPVTDGQSGQDREPIGEPVVESQTVVIPELLPDQKEYLQNILDHQAKGYDREQMVGGPNKPEPANAKAMVDNPPHIRRR